MRTDEQGQLSLAVEMPDRHQSRRSTKIFQAFTQADSSTTRQFGGTFGFRPDYLTKTRGTDAGTPERPVRPKTQAVGSHWTLCHFAQVRRPGLKFSIRCRKSNEPTIASLRVLVAEDNDVNRLVAKGMLRRLHINPLVVNDGLAALRCCSEQLDLIHGSPDAFDGWAPGDTGHSQEAPLNQMTPDRRLDRRFHGRRLGKCLTRRDVRLPLKTMQQQELGAIVLKWTQARQEPPAPPAPESHWTLFKHVKQETRGQIRR